MYVERLAYGGLWCDGPTFWREVWHLDPQAFWDISEYLRRNPPRWRYLIERKRYEPMPAMRPAFGQGTWRIRRSLRRWSALVGRVPASICRTAMCRPIAPKYRPSGVGEPHD